MKPTINTSALPEPFATIFRLYGQDWGTQEAPEPAPEQLPEPSVAIDKMSYEA